MALNRGVVDSFPLEPTEFGLFAYAKPNDHLTDPNNEDWVRGFYQMYDSLPNYVRVWDETSSYSFVSSDNPGSPLYRENKPVFLEVEDFRSTFDLPFDEKYDRVLKQLEGVSQKALEYELWNGEIAQVQGLPNLHLSHPSVTVIANGVAVSPRRGLSLLEHYTGEMSPAGEHGVFHLTRDAFVLMTSNSNIFLHEEGKEHMQTSSGAPVIIGSGYSGDGPHIAIDTIAVSTNTVTVTTLTNHYFVDGESVQIYAQVGDTDFNGTYVVDATGDKTFTFSMTTGNLSATAPTNANATAQMQGSDTAKWVYATGRVDTLLGKSVVVNETRAQGYGVSGNKNDMRVKATRPAVAYFDPSIHLAVKIDLTA